MKALVVISVLALAAAGSALAATGKQTYAAWCAGCHQADGSGIKGAFPALAGSAIAVGDPAAPIDLVLNGKGAMPPMGSSLSDAEIAEVLTYVRSSFGNHASAVTAAEIARARAAHR